MSNDKLSIAFIEAENFLLIKKLEYTPRPGINIFVGKNMQGKTDVIRLIKVAFKNAGAEIISHGKDKASLMVRLSDGHEIRRTFTEKSKRFQVKTPEGDFKASPQAFLDAILGDADLSFDPIAFVLKVPKEQKQMLLQTFNIGKVTPEMLSDIVDKESLTRMDFNKDGLAVLKDAENIIYTKRAEINKELAKKNAIFDELSYKCDDDFDPKTFSGDKTITIRDSIIRKEKEISEAKALKKQVEGTQSLIDRLNAQIKQAEQEASEIVEISALETEISATENRIEELEEQIKYFKNKLLNLSQSKNKKERFLKQIEDNKATLESLKFEEIPDIDLLQKELGNLHDVLNKNILEVKNYRIYEESQIVLSEYEKLKKESDELTSHLKKLREELPSEIMKGATLPFESFSFDEDEVIIDGNRLSLMATSEQLFVTLKIYKERNKDARLKIICADRIEILDDESYKKFWEFVNTEGYQVFATKVISAQVPDDAVMIEGGELREKIKEVEDSKV